MPPAACLTCCCELSGLEEPGVHIDWDNRILCCAVIVDLKDQRCGLAVQGTPCDVDCAKMFE
eukprot:6247912-Prymnesium_polylepis.1